MFSIRRAYEGWIYYVNLMPNGQGLGEGIAVMQGKSVNGGDTDYTYTGYKQASSDGFSPH